MKPLLIVDGYNVIGAWREAREQGYSLDESRDRLFRLLQDYAGYTGEEVLLVFDGHHSGRKIRSVEKLSLAAMVFTKHGETADSYIERQVALTPRYRMVRVATNDALEQSQILAGGASRMTAGELIQALNTTRREKAREREMELPVKKNPLYSHLTDAQREMLEKMRRGR